MRRVIFKAILFSHHRAIRLRRWTENEKFILYPTRANWLRHKLLNKVAQWLCLHLSYLTGYRISKPA